MKEKIVVLDFESKNPHLITKQLRKLGYYTEIAFQNTDISELENVKGFVFASKNELPTNLNLSENYLNIDSINIPTLKIIDTETFPEDKIFTEFAESCGMKKNWTEDDILEHIIEKIKLSSQNKKVLLFLSGGVVSTVAFTLLNKALGQDRVLGLHIDNGFMRKNESKLISDRYIKFGFSNFILEDDSEIFLDGIKNIIDSQEKTRIIGETFLQVHNKIVETQNLLESQLILAQGTLYPDVIKNGITKNNHSIKIHQTKIAGIQNLLSKGLIIEPLKDLYKDEVRLIGKKLGLPEELVMRHPFPGAGLSVNVICSNDVLTSQEERELKKLNQKIQEINLSEFFKNETSEIKTLPIKTIGLKGNFRTQKFCAILKVDSQKIPDWEILENASTYITNSVEDVNRVIYCIYEKENCVLQEHFCTKQRLDQTREIDEIVINELKENNWYSKIYQHLTINLPYSTSKDKCSIVLRPVISVDGTTAKFAKIPLEILEKIIEKISKLDFVDGLYFDITNKPPAKITWE